MRRSNKRFLILFIIASLCSTLAFGQATAVGKSGMVASADRLASEVGVEILNRGGNAVDAAIAVHMALAVSYPQAGNIGGGGFFVIHLQDKGIQTTIDFREKAPAAATRDMYLDAEGNYIAGSSRFGYLAAGVPGSVAGLWHSFKKYGSGKLTWAELMEPAYKLAKDGYELNYWRASSLAGSTRKFNSLPATAAIYTNGGEAWKFGDKFIQSDLAATIKLIAKEGRDGFYKGKIAKLIAADMAANGGLITEEDLANYQPVERAPIRGTFRGQDYISMPPPSSGGVLLKQMLNMLETYDLKSMGLNSSQYVHTVTEVERLAYADRAEHLGDMDFYDVPIEQITSREYAAERLALINDRKATRSSEISHGKAIAKESLETTHFSIVDQWGNAVSCTTTLNGSYGSCVVAPGTGVMLNNEMDDFSVKPGVPNMYGVLGGEANSILPGKRMLSSMTPTIVLKDGKVDLVIGSPGGSTIITVVMQVLLNSVEFDLPLFKAVVAPRFHHQWLPDRLSIESFGFANDVLTRLESMGHSLAPRSALGDVHAIQIDHENGLIFGVSDPRRGGTAIGTRRAAGTVAVPQSGKH
jgi:gamma-glutamyltranspeptidase/glutathione hydrolase